MKITTNTQTPNQVIDRQSLINASNNKADQQQAIATSKLDQNSIPATPSVIYHANESTNPVVLTKGDKFEIYRVAQNFDTPDINKVSRNMSRIENSMKPAYVDFKQQLGNTYPQLANKEFGFTVESDGTLSILDNKFQLSTQEHEDLSQFINNYGGSENLSKLALKYAEASIEFLAADRGLDNASLYVGRFDLTMDNFSEAFDFALMLTPGSFRGGSIGMGDQIYSSGLEEKYKYAQYETFVDGKWVKVDQQNK